MRFRILLPLVSMIIISCDDLDEISRDNRILTGQIQSDVGGVLTASVDTASGSAVVGASSSSAISGASVLFPSGSLSIPTDIIVEEGASIATAAFMSSVDESAAAGLTQASSAVSVSSSTAQDAVSPFSISLPLSGFSLNLAEESAYIAVLFKIYKAGEDKYYSGVIPTNQLTITPTDVKFTTSNFGVFQAIYIKTAITERSEQVADTSILTKSQERKLAVISWQRPTYTYDDTQRILTASVTATNLQEPRDCVIILDKDKAQVWDYVRRTSSNTLSALEIPVSSALVGTFYVAVSCMDKYGRISNSLWSESRVAIQSSATGSAFAVTQRIPAPGIPTQNLLPNIEITFNNNVDSNSVTPTSISLKNSYTHRQVPIVGLNITGNKLIFKPGEPLALNGRYRVYLDSGIKDVTGKSLAAQEWEFDTNKPPVSTISDSSMSASVTQAKVFDLGNNTFLQLFKDGDSLKSSYFNGSIWQAPTKVDSTNLYTDGTLNYEAHLMPDKSILLICACDETLPSSLSPLRAYRGNLSGSSWVWGSHILFNSQISIVSGVRSNFKSTMIPGAGVVVMYEAKASSTYHMKFDLLKDNAWQGEQILEATGRISYSADLIALDHFKDHALFAWTYFDGSSYKLITNKFKFDQTIPAPITTSLSILPDQMRVFLSPNLVQTIFIKEYAGANVAVFHKPDTAPTFDTPDNLSSYSELNVIKKPDGRLIFVSNPSYSDSTITATVIKDGTTDSNYSLQGVISGLTNQSIAIHQGMNADWVIATTSSSSPTPGTTTVKVWKHQANTWTGPFPAFSTNLSGSTIHTHYGHDEFDNFLMYSSHDDGGNTDWSKFYFNQLTGMNNQEPVVSLPYYNTIDAPCSLAVRPTGESIMTCFNESGSLKAEIRR